MTVLVPHDERRAVAGAAVAAGSRLEGLPQPLAVREPRSYQGAQSAIGAVDRPVLNDRRGIGAVDGVLGSPAPDDLGCRLAGVELQQRGDIADAAGVQK